MYMIYSAIYTTMLENASFEEFTSEYKLEYLRAQLKRDSSSLSDWKGDSSPEGRAGRLHWGVIIMCRKSHIKMMELTK